MKKIIILATIILLGIIILGAAYGCDSVDHKPQCNEDTTYETANTK